MPAYFHPRATLWWPRLWVGFVLKSILNAYKLDVFVNKIYEKKRGATLKGWLISPE